MNRAIARIRQKTMDAQGVPVRIPAPLPSLPTTGGFLPVLTMNAQTMKAEPASLPMPVGIQAPPMQAIPDAKASAVVEVTAPMPPTSWWDQELLPGVKNLYLVGGVAAFLGLLLLLKKK